MKIFVSWSGDRSKIIAKAFHDFVSDVLQNVKPFLSSHDQHAGTRWPERLMRELANTNFGVLCLTPENVDARWIMFEAGALSKALANVGIVCPYLWELKSTQLQWPLAQFMANVIDKEGTFNVVASINDAMGELGLTPEKVTKQFERCWPEYEAKLKAIPPAPEQPQPPTTTMNADKALDEIMAYIRNAQQEKVANIRRHLGSPPPMSDDAAKRRLAKARASIAAQKAAAKFGRTEIIPWRMYFQEGPLDDTHLSSDLTGFHEAMGIAISKATNGFHLGHRFKLVKVGDKQTIYKVVGHEEPTYMSVAQLHASSDDPDHDATYEIVHQQTDKGVHNVYAAFVPDVPASGQQ